MKRFLITLIVVAALMIPFGVGAVPQATKAAPATYGCATINFSTFNTHPYNNSATTATVYNAVTYNTTSHIDVMIGYRVDGTNNSSNYWNINFKNQNTGDVLAYMGTWDARWCSVASSTWSYCTTHFDLDSGDVVVAVQADKVGSPGNLSLAGPQACGT